MPIRWGTGPVFVYESITAARRWQSYAMRSLFVFALLICLWTVWQTTNAIPGVVTSQYTLRELAQLGERMFYGVAGVQLSLVLLAAPAATAGAVCLDRARGSLTHIFVTDLSDSEIVLGKLAARLLPVAALVASGVPVLALMTLLGGIIPEALVILTLVTASLALFCCSLALAFSARATRTHEVLLAVFALLTLWLISLPIWLGTSRSNGYPAPPEWYQKLNPFVLAYGPYSYPGWIEPFDVCVFVFVMSVTSAALLFYTLRVIRRDLPPPRTRSERWEARVRALKRRLISWWPSPGLDPNPVLWREWHRSSPSRMARRVQMIYLIFVVTGMAIGIYETLTDGIRNGPNWLILTNFLGVGFGLLILSVTAPTALSEERVRGSLDVLMTTPMSTRAIVLGKWWGLYRRWLPLVLLPLVSGLFVAVATPELPPFAPARMQPRPIPIDLHDRICSWSLPVVFLLAHAAVATSLGLALATWVRQPGRALALSVAAYLAVAVGWIVAVEAVIRPLIQRIRSFNGYYAYDHALNQSLICLSPVASQVTPYEILSQYWIGESRKWLWGVLGVEVALTTLLAAALLAATVLTFDRCLGRVPELSEGPALVPLAPGRSAATDLSASPG
ncbi:MAG: ABC transporter permease subunit [Isosphaeraceae bacterium]